MKAKATKLKDSTTMEFDVAIFHYLSEEKVLSLQLKGGLLSETPEKTIYKIELFQDDGTSIIDTFDMCLFMRYNYTIDDANTIGEDGIEVQTAPIVNNSIGFSVA